MASPAEHPSFSPSFRPILPISFATSPHSTHSQSPVSYANLPLEILHIIFSYLDQKALLRCAQVCHKYQNLTYVYTRFFKQLNLLSQSKDLYGLFALEVPAELKKNAETLPLLTQSIKVALQSYVFMDALASLRIRGFLATRYNLLKLLGKDYRNLQHNAQPLESPHAQLTPQAFSEYEEAASPFQLDDRNLFTMTPEAAKILCLVIQETPQIDSLILLSQPNKKDQAEISSSEQYFSLIQRSFGDDVVKILAKNLPEHRFKMLIIAGGFGNKGVQALRKKIPHLLSSDPINPKNIQIAGGRATQAEDQQTDEEKLQYFTIRQQTDPTSVTTKQELCAIM